VCYSYDGQALGKRRRGILSPIVTTFWVKHDNPGFDGRGSKPMTIKIIFMKEKHMMELNFSSK
jgi:hypothetical protein